MSKTDKQKSIPATALKSIGDLNPAFEMNVGVQARAGAEVMIKLQCQAHGKLEWAAIRDKANDEARERSEKRVEAASEDDAKSIRIVDVVRETMAAESALVMEFATGWDLSDELSAESLQRLENKCGGSISAMISKYEIAIYQGRLGN